MLDILLLGAVASLIFLNTKKEEKLEIISTKTYKNLIKDLMEHHGITQTEWKNNLRINKKMNGIVIGSDKGFIHLAENRPIKLYIGSKKIKFKTDIVPDVIKKMMKMIKSDKYSEDDKKIITNVLNNLIKYQDYYYLKKYLKYKKLYSELKDRN